jgi:hypothetical protein
MNGIKWKINGLKRFFPFFLGVALMLTGCASEIQFPALLNVKQAPMKAAVVASEPISATTSNSPFPILDSSLPAAISKKAKLPSASTQEEALNAPSLESEQNSSLVAPPDSTVEAVPANLSAAAEPIVAPVAEVTNSAAEPIVAPAAEVANSGATVDAIVAPAEVANSGAEPIVAPTEVANSGAAETIVAPAAEVASSVAEPIVAPTEVANSGATVDAIAPAAESPVEAVSIAPSTPAIDTSAELENSIAADKVYP